MVSKRIATDRIAGRNHSHETIDSMGLAPRCLEIEASFPGSSCVVLSLAGGLQASHLTKLRMLVQSAQGLGLHVTLNLVPLQSAELGALREALNWRDDDVTILGCPGYVESWVRNEVHAGEARVAPVSISGSAPRLPGTHPSGMDLGAKQESRTARGGAV